MKALAVLLVLCLSIAMTKASDPYRDYLLSQVFLRAQPKTIYTSTTIAQPGTSAFIPHVETPRGAIFCRMEDKVTKATKVWLKLGVQ